MILFFMRIIICAGYLYSKSDKTIFCYDHFNFQIITRSSELVKMDIPDVGALDAPPGVGEGQGLPDSTYDCFTLLPADQLGKQKYACNLQI